MTRQYRFLLIYFGLAMAISWILWAPLWLPALGVTGLPVLPFHHAYGALGPISAAFIVASLESGRSGILDLLKRMVLWRGRLTWLLVALAAPFGILAIAALIVWAWTGERPSLAGFGVSKEFPQFSALGFLLYNIITFGYGEETGWRGYALPRLQARHSALVATLLLSVGWALWHGPVFLYRPGYVSMGPAEIVGWFFSILCGAIILTWLFNESRGSLAVVALFHATIDILFTSDISTPQVVNLAGAFVTLWGVALLFIVGPRYLARVGKVTSFQQDGCLVTDISRASSHSTQPTQA